jgi:hypothetical protein
MAITYNTSIVRSGLVLHLDAANPKSYPVSGTVWTDLNNKSYNATSVGSPTFTNSYFTLNGTSQYFTVSGTPLTATTTCTILMWIYRAASQASFTGLFFNRNGANVCGLNFQGTTNKLGWTWNNSATTYNYDTGLTVPLNTWSMVGMSVGATSTTFWLNNTSNTQTFTTAAQTFDTILIGRDSFGSRYFNGRIATAMLYNRALTPLEIQQNFEALRGRYNV